jgi:hypothetical protein
MPEPFPWEDPCSERDISFMTEDFDVGPDLSGKAAPHRRGYHEKPVAF